MKHAMRMLLVVFALGCANLAAAQELTPVAKPEALGFIPARLDKITQTYQGYVDRSELPGAVMLIARDNQIVYLKAIGYQDRGKNIPMKTDAIFRLASMTKPIVSVAVMTLAEEGKLDLVDPVSKYLPEFAGLKVGVEQTDPATGKPALNLVPQKRPMTVQDLLRHTSGLVYGQFGEKLVHLAYRDAKIGDRDDTLAEMVTKLSKLPLAHQPGEVWEYSVSVDVLGRIVEIVSGMGLDQFVSERITGPLKMNATDFYVHETNLERLAEAQKPPADSTSRMPPDVTKRPKLLSGGGGMVASIGDYFRFCEMLLNLGDFGGVRILAPHTVTLMTSDALPPGVAYTERTLTRPGGGSPIPALGQGFGLGFGVRTEPGRNPLPGSVGNYYWGGAWGTTFWIDPREKLVAIQMIQTPTEIGAPYSRVFRNMVYAAMTNPE